MNGTIAVWRDGRFWRANVCGRSLRTVSLDALAYGASGFVRGTYLRGAVARCRSGNMFVSVRRVDTLDGETSGSIVRSLGMHLTGAFVEQGDGLAAVSAN